MKLPSLKLLTLALAANLVPLATGIVQILLGNVGTGVGAIAGGLGAAVVQVVNAQAEAKQTRSLLTSGWFFSRTYVWFSIGIGFIASLILLGHYL